MCDDTHCSFPNTLNAEIHRAWTIFVLHSRGPTTNIPTICPQGGGEQGERRRGSGYGETKGMGGGGRVAP